MDAWKLAFYGGLAGEMLWLASYPLDVVKSKMQTDGLSSIRTAQGVPTPEQVRMSSETNAKFPSSTPSLETAETKHLGHRHYPTMRSCFAQTFRKEGFVGFWKGIGPTLLRAMPVSAATFAV